MGHQSAESTRSFVQVRGNLRAVDAKGPQEPCQYFSRRYGLLDVIPMQVDVKLAIGEQVGRPVCPMHGQCRLADTGGAGDGRNDDG